MNSGIKLLKLIIPGLLPLIVFIAADEFIDTLTAIIVAIISGIGVAIWSYIKYKKVDRFIVFDTILLALFGGISIGLDNDVFFKIKPGVIQLILVTILGTSAFSGKNIMLAMAQRYMPGQKLSEEQVSKLRQQTIILFWIFLVHTLLVFYSAFYMSKEAWGFISGGLFYILAGAWFLFEFVKQKIITAKIEWLPVLNDKGEVIGKASREQCHNGSKIRHPVIHLHVFNQQGQLFLQKRSKNKQIQPGKYDTSVGGHISFGETPEKALMRESKEEIGINVTGAKFLFAYQWESEIEKELVYVHALQTDAAPNPNPKELDGGKFMNISEIKENLGKGWFTPNFEHEFKILLKHIDYKKSKK